MKTEPAAKPLLPIPTEVRHEDLLEALKPLCALLNITPNHFYEVPGLQIGFNAITFVVPSPATQEEWDKPRPGSRRAELDVHGREVSAAELAQVAHVKVLQP